MFIKEGMLMEERVFMEAGQGESNVVEGLL